MKRCLPALALIAMAVSSSFAESPRIVVVPVKDATGAYGALAADLTDIARDEVRRAGYAVVAEYAFFTRWWRVAAAAWKSDEPVPTPEEYEKKKRSGDFHPRDIFNHDFLGTVIDSHDAWTTEKLGADIAVMGDLRRDGEGLEISLEMLDLGSGRYCSAVRQAKTGQEEKAFKDGIASLLGKAGVIRAPEADEEVDGALSKVGYRVKTTTGEIIAIRVDYASNRPDPPLQHVDLLPPPDLKEGVRSYRLPTREGEDIVIEFHMQHASVESVSVGRASDPAARARGQATRTVTSEGGYGITFTFSKEGDTETSVRCEPLRNPYACGQVGK